jgi:hypothetical protein
MLDSGVGLTRRRLSVRVRLQHELRNGLKRFALQNCPQLHNTTTVCLHPQETSVVDGKGNVDED